MKLQELCVQSRLYGTGRSRISSLVRTCIDIGRVTLR
jgi:hypothetical protein